MDNKAMAKMLSQDIDAWCEATYNKGFRNHLGASLMGRPCSRQLWYSFRWIKYRNNDARMCRLYERGHREEPWMVLYLRGIGCEVWEFDTSLPRELDGSYPQYRISGVQGHFGGSLDCIAILPPRYEYNKPLSISFKTSGTGAKFTELGTKGVPLAKPVHHVQESIYGYKMGFEKYGYMCANKNDDNLHIGIHDVDVKEAARQEKRAETIIFSKTPPARVSENPSYIECSVCDYAGVCHGNTSSDVNCRSCVHASPVENGQWYCAGYKAVIPSDIIKVGCPNWASILDQSKEV